MFNIRLLRWDANLVTLKSLSPLSKLTELWIAITQELCKTHRHALVLDQDIRTLVRRSRSEGIPFLAVSLPCLAKDVYRSFQTGCLEVDSRFSRKKNSCLPVFLNSFFLYLYEQDGSIKELTDERQMGFKVLLQILGLYKKLEGPYQADVLSQMADEFIGLQDRQPSIDRLALVNSQFNNVLNCARGILETVFIDYDPKDIPLHGSGAVADRLSRVDRYVNLYDHPVMLDAVQQHCSYWIHADIALKGYRISERKTARVVSVVKEYGKPRFITVIDSDLMLKQQAIMNDIMSFIETGNHSASGYVNFTDQEINQSLVCCAHEMGLATMDLKDASNLVFRNTAWAVLPGNIFEKVDSCRPTYVDLDAVSPGAGVIELNTFLPQGAATCFPIEALVFWAIATAVSRLFGDGSPVWVYGDDIICSMSIYVTLVKVFTAVGFKVNLDKSYSDGPFRESCGLDVLSNTDVTPVRFRNSCYSLALSCNALSSKEGSSLFNDGTAKLTAHLSTVAFIRQMVDKWGTSLGDVIYTIMKPDLLFPLVSSHIVPEHPFGVPLSLCESSIIEKYRFNGNLQRKEVRLISCIPSRRSFSKHATLNKNSLVSKNDQFEIIDHVAECTFYVDKLARWSKPQRKTLKSYDPLAYLNIPHQPSSLSVVAMCEWDGLPKEFLVDYGGRTFVLPRTLEVRFDWFWLAT